MPAPLGMANALAGYCPACNRKVHLTVPPRDGLIDPWLGSPDARAHVHWFPRENVATR